jgi:adenylosuccinate synthase
LQAYIVIDLGFGDCGKGLLTDFLVRKRNAGLVVRYNGGAQAGHHVVTPDGRQHTFSQFGSGTFVPRVKTFLSRHVVIDPAALLVEGDILVAKNVPDAFSRLRVSDRALVITPFHRAANRIREILRGENRHGSCGVGVGEAVEDAQQYPETRVLAGDLANPGLLRRKLSTIRERKRTRLEELLGDFVSNAELDRERQIFTREDVIDLWMDSLSRINALHLVVPDALLEKWLGETEKVIFEGAQGVLLDAEAGFHPYTTWSNCRADNAHEILEEMAPGASITRVGVMRSYAVRHGPGPLPTETPELDGLVSEHNRTNAWQGRVRYGWFDAVLGRYALDASGGVNALAVTHMDLLPSLKSWNYCSGYALPRTTIPEIIDSKISDSMQVSFRIPNHATLDERRAVSSWLSTVSPVVRSCPPEETQVVQKIEDLLCREVNIVSGGNKAEDVETINSF